MFAYAVNMTYTLSTEKKLTYLLTYLLRISITRIISMLISLKSSLFSSDSSKFVLSHIDRFDLTSSQFCSR